MQWRYLPHDFPNWNTVYGYFAKWQPDGIFAQLNGLLRELVRQREGRNAEPSACVIDAQSVKTATSIPATNQGTDAGKKTVGRKRSIVTDTLGLLLAALVTAASVQDSVAGTQLIDHVATTHASIRKVWVDGGYRRAFRRARRHPRHRHGDRPTHPRGQGLHPDPEAVDGRADLRLADVAPPPGARLRDPPCPLRSHDPPRHDRPQALVLGSSFAGYMSWWRGS